ncbi:hypothetical protein FACS1894147_09030 [Spirochaetia bacterium]|nr:hypothetical protein FACS1894147_09030 [Spirochaetia bacterium]
MAFCVNCGTKLEEGAKFCLQCGTAVEVGQPVQPQAAPVQAVQQQPSQSSAMKNAKVYKITGLICIILGCLGTGVGVANSAVNVLIYTIPMAALGFFALNKAKKLQKTG